MYETCIFESSETISFKTVQVIIGVGLKPTLCRRLKVSTLSKLWGEWDYLVPPSQDFPLLFFTQERMKKSLRAF